MTTLQTALTVATTATTSATLAAGKHTPVDATSGNLTMALPTPAHVGARLRVEKVDPTTNTVTVSGTIRGSAGTVVLSAQYGSVELVAESLSSWRPSAGFQPSSTGGGLAAVATSGSYYDLANTPEPSDSSPVAVGEDPFSRFLASASTIITSGFLYLSFFTARKTETVNNLTISSRGTAAAGTTLARLGLYTVDGSGNLALVASTASDTTLLGATFSIYTRAVTVPYAKTAGARYAWAFIWLGTTAPAVYAMNSGADSGVAPFYAGTLASQSNLPASIAAGGFQTAANPLYGRITP